MADYGGQRQQRQADFVPEPPRRILSDEAMEYITSAADLRRQATQDPALTGADALKRLRSPDGG